MKNWKDIYQLPLKQRPYISWVYDSANNFVFQFTIDDELFQQNIINILNGLKKSDALQTYYHKEGKIIGNITQKSIILIRGWGNLTGTGAHNLPSEEAANIQDTFAEWIVQTLNTK